MTHSRYTRYVYVYAHTLRMKERNKTTQDILWCIYSRDLLKQLSSEEFRIFQCGLIDRMMGAVLRKLKKCFDTLYQANNVKTKLNCFFNIINLVIEIILQVLFYSSSVVVLCSSSFCPFSVCPPWSGLKLLLFDHKSLVAKSKINKNKTFLYNWPKEKPKNIRR